MEAVLDIHIEIDAEIRNNKPHLANSRITVADVVLMHFRLGQSVEEIAVKYDLLLPSVYSALAYYYDHREEVDQSIEDDQAFAEAFRKNNVSPLREKLALLSRA